MMHRFALTVAVEASSAADAFGALTPRMPRVTMRPAPTVSRRILFT